AQVRTWIAGGQVRLRQKGQGVAWKADPSNDALYFFGQALANPDAVYARRNVYLLDHAAGTTMQVTPGSGPAPVPGPQSFPSRIHVERTLMPAPFLAQDPTADLRYWGYAQTPPSFPGEDAPNFPIDAPDALATGTAKLSVNLQGATNLVPGNDHHARLIV